MKERLAPVSTMILSGLPLTKTSMKIKDGFEDRIGEFSNYGGCGKCEVCER